MKHRGRLVKLGVTTIVLAILGWLGTVLVTPFLHQPHTVEDLTAAWTRAGATPLEKSTRVTVQPDETLVAFLVGTDLRGIAGTTSGTCTAATQGRPVQLGWPVLVNRSLSGVLGDGQQTVSIAGWENRTQGPVTLDISCGTNDSTVDHFVALPSRSAVVVGKPWFQPWAWVGLGLVGVALVAAGAVRLSPPNR